MPTFAVTAIGPDRPGIVAAVTGALAEAGANLLDASMASLGGQFAILLLVDAEGEGSGLEAVLVGPASDLGLAVLVRGVQSPSGDGAAGPSSERWHISVHGRDRPGIVHAVATALAEMGANVVDLATHRVGPDPAAYAMSLEVDVPTDGAADLAARLTEVGERLDVRCTAVRPDADVL